MPANFLSLKLTQAQFDALTNDEKYSAFVTLVESLDKLSSTIDTSMSGINEKLVDLVKAVRAS